MDALKNITNSFGDTAGKAREVFSTGKMQVIALAVVAITVVVIIGSFVYKKLTSSYVNQNSYTLDATKGGRILNKVTECTDYTKLPDMTANGQRCTFSFWVYIHNLNTDGTYRYVFRRGATSADVNLSTSPLVFFDNKLPNRMYIRIPKKGMTTLSEPSKDNPMVSLPGAGPYYKNMTGDYLPYTMEDELAGFRGVLYKKDSTQYTEISGTEEAAWTSYDGRTVSGITIPYIPIQRWVHVAVVVNEQVNGGTITAYLDAEQVAQIKNAGTNFQLSSTGAVYLGDDTNGFDGLISYLTFHNFDMNPADIYKEYRMGPIRNLLTKLGLPAYGLRSPVYALSTSGVSA